MNPQRAFETPRTARTCGDVSIDLRNAVNGDRHARDHRGELVTGVSCASRDELAHCRDDLAGCVVLNQLVRRLKGQLGIDDALHTVDQLNAGGDDAAFVGHHDIRDIVTACGSSSRVDLMDSCNVHKCVSR